MDTYTHRVRVHQFVYTHLQGTVRPNVSLMTYKLDKLFWAARLEWIKEMKYTLRVLFLSAPHEFIIMNTYKVVQLSTLFYISTLEIDWPVIRQSPPITSYLPRLRGVVYVDVPCNVSLKDTGKATQLSFCSIRLSNLSAFSTWNFCWGHSEVGKIVSCTVRYRPFLSSCCLLWA